MITETIPKQSFEIVRDRIAEILANELPSQSTKNLDPFLDATVGIERMIPIDKTESPFINVQCGKGDYTLPTQISRDGNYTYYIDCYLRGIATDNSPGDKDAQLKLQRLMGVVQNIMNHWEYKTLGWQPPVIARAYVNEINFPDSKEFLNAPNMIAGRLFYEVRIQETADPFQPLNIDSWTTVAKLGNTENGYIFSGENPTIPPPPICADAIVKNSDNSFSQIIPSGDTYIAPDINITINDLGFLSIPSIIDQNIILKDTHNNIIQPDNISNNTIFIEKNGNICADGNVSNSDDSYTGTVSSGGNLELPDIELLINGVSQGNFPSVQDVDLPFAGGSSDSLKPTKSGQVISYAPNDDGAIQFGRDTDFFTLSWTNPFGNNDRFTDINGLQVYGNDIIIDWTTYDSLSGSVSAFYMTIHTLSSREWVDWMTGSPYTLIGFNDWNVFNMKQASFLLNWGDKTHLAYAPFNYLLASSGRILWTATTSAFATTSAIALSTNLLIQGRSKTEVKGTVLTRQFTLAELGL